MTKDELLNSGLLEEYVLGLCPEEVAVEIEQLAEADPEVRQMIRRLKSGVHDYCKKTQKSVSLRKKSRLSGKVSAFSKTILGMTGIVALGFAILTIHFYSKTQELRSQNDRLLAAFDNEKEHWEARVNESVQMQSLHHLLTHRNTKQIQLVSVDNKNTTDCLIYWNDRERNAMMHILELPPPPNGWCYKVWADSAGKMVDMGIIHLSRRWHELPYLPNISAINITMEPQASELAPTAEHLFCKGEIH